MLYVVPTPIGNLKDITLRAIEVLKSVDYILAEDTRTSKVLLQHYQIQKTVYSYHQHNEHRNTILHIEAMQQGKHIALISDAGTPGISDPGYMLIRDCVKENIQVECLPGAVAFVPALLLSAFPIHHFIYVGFLPIKKGRQSLFLSWKNEEKTIVFYESPHRILKTLQELQTHLGAERLISVSREISKKFEETIRGNIREVLCHFQKHEPRGEFVVVLNGSNE